MHNLSKKTQEMLDKLTPQQRDNAMKIVAEVAQNRAKKALEAKAKLKGETDGKATNNR